MVKHKKTKCNKVSIVPYADGGISQWICPKCKMVFQCGNEKTMEMFCTGFT